MADQPLSPDTRLAAEVHRRWEEATARNASALTAVHLHRMGANPIPHDPDRLPSVQQMELDRQLHRANEARRQQQQLIDQARLQHQRQQAQPAAPRPAQLPALSAPHQQQSTPQRPLGIVDQRSVVPPHGPALGPPRGPTASTAPWWTAPQPPQPVGAHHPIASTSAHPLEGPSEAEMLARRHMWASQQQAPSQGPSRPDSAGSYASTVPVAGPSSQPEMRTVGTFVDQARAWDPARPWFRPLQSFASYRPSLPPAPPPPSSSVPFPRTAKPAETTRRASTDQGLRPDQPPMPVTRLQLLGVPQWPYSSEFPPPRSPDTADSGRSRSASPAAAPAVGVPNTPAASVPAPTPAPVTMKPPATGHKPDAPPASKGKRQATTAVQRAAIRFDRPEPRFVCQWEGCSVRTDKEADIYGHDVVCPYGKGKNRRYAHRVKCRVAACGMEFHGYEALDAHEDLHYPHRLDREGKARGARIEERAAAAAAAAFAAADAQSRASDRAAAPLASSRLTPKPVAVSASTSATASAAQGAPPPAVVAPAQPLPPITLAGTPTTAAAPDPLEAAPTRLPFDPSVPPTGAEVLQALQLASVAKAQARPCTEDQAGKVASTTSPARFRLATGPSGRAELELAQAADPGPSRLAADPSPSRLAPIVSPSKRRPQSPLPPITFALPSGAPPSNASEQRPTSSSALIGQVAPPARSISDRGLSLPPYLPVLGPPPHPIPTAAPVSDCGFRSAPRSASTPLSPRSLLDTSEGYTPPIPLSPVPIPASTGEPPLSHTRWAVVESGSGPARPASTRGRPQFQGGGANASPRRPTSSGAFDNQDLRHRNEHLMPPPPPSAASIPVKRSFSGPPPSRTLSPTLRTPAVHDDAGRWAAFKQYEAEMARQAGSGGQPPPALPTAMRRSVSDVHPRTSRAEGERIDQTRTYDVPMSSAREER